MDIRYSSQICIYVYIYLYTIHILIYLHTYIYNINIVHWRFESCQPYTLKGAIFFNRRGLDVLSPFLFLSKTTQSIDIVSIGGNR